MEVELSSLFWGNGRTSRKRFWIVTGSLWLFTFLIGFVRGFATARGDGGLIALVALPLILVSSWMSLINTIRRLHDFDKSGWQLLWVVPASGLMGAMFAIGAMGLKLGGLPAQWGQIGGSVAGVGMIILIGRATGDVGENRFGGPPDMVPAAAFD